MLERKKVLSAKPSALVGSLVGIALVSGVTAPALALPVAVDDYYETPRDTPLTVSVSSVLENDYDPTGVPYFFSDYVDDPVNGTATFDPSTSSITFVPAPQFVGEGYFTYAINDGSDGYAGWAWARVHVDVTGGSPTEEPPDGGADPSNTPPVGVDDSLQGQPDAPLVMSFGELVTNDIDVNGEDVLYPVTVNDAQHGDVELREAEQQVVFTPDPGFVGEASFFYAVTDGHDGGDWGLMGFAQVTIDFSGQTSGTNTAPVARDDLGFMVLEGEDLVVGFDELMANDSDPEGDPLEVVAAGNVSGGSATLDGSSRTITFVPGAGVDSAVFEYTVSDGALTSSADVEVTIVDASTLTVTNGSGSGSYAVGTQVQIVAQPAPNRQRFSAWEGDVETVADVRDASTTVLTTDGDLEIAAIYERPSDREPPSTPTGLTTSAIFPNSFTLQWAPSSDNVSVAGYRVTVNGELSATTTEPSATIAGLSPETTYDARVVAFDGSGNVSTSSSVLRVTTLPSTSPDSYNAFFFGHSLVNHRAEGHNLVDWAGDLAQANGQSLSGDGEYGFLPNHVTNLPVEDGENFFTLAQTPSGWSGSFAASDYDAAIITAANYLQNWIPPTGSYWEDGQDTGLSPVDHSITLLDYVRSQEPGIDVLIYEHWPEFDTAGVEFPASAEGMAAYHQYTRGAFHDWWLTLQDEIVRERPNSRVKLVPAGYIMAGLFLEFPELAAIESTTLYEDSAPHGEPTIYFLAGLVHYMAFYGQPPAGDYPVPSSVHPAVRDNFEAIIAYAWRELNRFTYADGTSRVF